MKNTRHRSHTTLAIAAPVWAQLRIGQPSGFSGSVAAGLKKNTDGTKLYFDAANARGGVNGQKVELISVDDKFDPKTTVGVSRPNSSGSRACWPFS